MFKFLKTPEIFYNIDTDVYIEKYELITDSEKPLFKLGNKYLVFKHFAIELQRQENKIKNIYLILPDTDKEKILEISKFFNMSEEQINEIENVEKGTLFFSLEENAIQNYIQPDYDSPEHSKNLFKFMDENENIVLLNFDYYQIETLQ